MNDLHSRSVQSDRKTRQRSAGFDAISPVEVFILLVLFLMKKDFYEINSVLKVTAGSSAKQILGSHMS